MRIFTKLILVATLVSSHLVSFAGSGDIEGVSPTYKGGNTLWKLMPERAEHLTLSANNARPNFVEKANDHTCSKIYASAVSQVFHVVERKQTKSMYANITLAAFAPGNDLKTSLPSINAYPNPSRGYTSLALNLPGNNNYKIRISNTIGKVLAVQEVAPADKARVDLDLSSLPSGVYFYSLLVNGKTVETKRLVLQK
ncbi:T9SS type A sorting domain-containing protein [Pontibacter mangrovi]|uniref:T9SS type A sorting domain-containing protein n=1 Tax=Pontibacter mangrovi TaxID=2589816 RepID=A0A501W524_9BACT|nr:T9SS type A sorting domain-containing protein [Pontibacter mangrovi]TPE44699.1 T9SS type A sorting domain-containing protein [Pontibacter mangrovi]